MKPLPSLRQLQHLVALAEQRHFGRAAAACNVGQSSLSASIAALEAILQAPLVDRTKRRVALTPLGRATVERARRILAEAGALVEAVDEARAPLSGELRLGVIPTIAPFLLPRAFPRLRRRFPQLRLYLTEELTERLVLSLHDGALDLVLLALPFEIGPAETVVLLDDPFRFACRKDHPLAAQEAVPVKAIEGADLLLLKDGHCLRDHALAACRLRSRQALDPFEATSLHTLVQMVDNGLGATLLPELAIAGGILKGTGLVTRPLKPAGPSRRIALAWRKGTGRRDEFLLLAETLKELAAAG
ncbi:MAG: hydrogen peroxide-inducible genes activator [Alphaproteobacteria bacterium]